MGLVDAATPRRHFENAARKLLLEPPPPHRPRFTAAVTDWPVVREVVARMSAKQVARRVRAAPIAAEVRTVAAKTILNAKNLEALGAELLAELLRAPRFLELAIARAARSS